MAVEFPEVKSMLLILVVVKFDEIFAQATPAAWRN